MNDSVTRRSAGENGAQYMDRIMNTHPSLCKEQLRLSSDMVKDLVSIMEDRGLLENSTRMTTTEQVGICLYIMATGASYRVVADIFKRSINTVGKYFDAVLEALKELSFDIVRSHNSFEEVPLKILGTNKYYPYFKDCIGAIDGNHFPAVIGDANGVPYRGRSGEKTWNVLACCDFDMLFTHVHVGWEGSVHDQTVWKDSLTDAKYCFPHPPQGKYYLVDSGYPNTLGYLAPYNNSRTAGSTNEEAEIICYHMPDFRNGQPPTGKKEKFNFLHSSLRSTIERSFGVLKRRWIAVRKMPPVKLERQTNVIIAALTLHNFIGMHKRGIPILEHSLVEGIADFDLYSTTRKNQMNEVRDFIAEEIMQSGVAIEQEDATNEDN